MSIALDIALYLRENDLSKVLSLPERSVLLTLAFRIGSNAYAWISQKELAKELYIKERCLIKHMSKLMAICLIERVEDPKDKRKNLYKPAEFLINYHQKRREKYVHERAGNNDDTCTNVHVNLKDTCTNVHVLNSKNISQVIENNEENNSKNSPKATLISKETCISKTKEDRKDRDVCSSKKLIDDVFEKQEEKLILPTQLNDESWSDFLQHRKSMKAPMSLVAQKRALKVLEDFQKGGYDVNEIVNTSIVNGWKGLFAPRINGSQFEQGNGNESTKHDGNFGKQIRKPERKQTAIEMVREYFEDQGWDYDSTSLTNIRRENKGDVQEQRSDTLYR